MYLWRWILHRQQLRPVAYIRNGSIYASKRNLIAKGIRYGTKNSRPYVMPKHKSVNIDNELDLIMAKQLIKIYPRNYIKKK